MCEYWLSANCPNCCHRNFVSGGDPNDPTGYDPQGIRCWHCKYGFSLDGDEMDADDCDDGVHFEEVRS